MSRASLVGRTGVNCTLVGKRRATAQRSGGARRIICGRVTTDTSLRVTPSGGGIPSPLKSKVAVCEHPSRSSKAERPPDKRKTAERYRAGRPAFALRASAREANLNLNERKNMKPVLRYQSQLLFRKSYKPDRLIRIRLAARALKVFRPPRARSEMKFSPSS